MSMHVLTAKSSTPSKADVLVLANSTTGALLVEGAAAGGAVMVGQNLDVDPSNSTVANLAIGASFVGAATPDLAYTAVQYTVKTDQLGIIYIEQSPDGTNWDISDSYTVYPGIGNGNTVQLVSSYYRVRFINIGSAPTTYLRIQTIGVPIISSLPRSLNQEGNLQVAIESSQDANGFLQQLSPFGEVLSVPTYRLIGSAFPGSTLDTNFWTAVTGTGGTVAPTNGTLIVATGTTANNAVSLTSVQTARYVTEQINKFSCKLQLPDLGVVNNTRRTGVFTANDGAFWEISGTQSAVVTRKGGVETSRTLNGNYNGRYGSSVILDILEHNYQIIYSLSDVYFLVDGVIAHHVHFNSAWSSTLDLPISITSTNANGLATNVVVNIFSASVMKYGIAATQPISFFQSGVTAGVTLKIGAGNLHGIVYGDNTGIITLYDNTAASGKVILIMTPNSTGSLDLKGIPFNIGLTIVTTATTSRWTILYE